MTQPSSIESRQTLRLRCDALGRFAAANDGQDALNAARRKLETHEFYWIEAAQLADELPERLGFAAELERGDSTLWALVRTGLAEDFSNLLPELEAIDDVVKQRRPGAIEIDDATDVGRAVVESVAVTHGIPVRVGSSPPRDSSFGRRVRHYAQSATRVLVGLTRAIRLGSVRAGAILSIDYTTLRRVRVGGRERFFNPYFAPVLDELRRRGLPEYRLNVPALSHPTQNRQWLRHGDADALPIEWPFARWRARHRRTAPAASVARASSIAEGALRAGPLYWRGIDIAPLARSLVGNSLGRRLTQRLTFVAFFDALIKRLDPSVLLLTSEYSGVALSARFAAMQLGVPTIGLQHGVIWRGHPGYCARQADVRRLARPDTVCVFGEFERQLLLREGGFSSDQVEVTGAPRLDYLGDGEPGISRDALAARLALRPGRPLVLFTSAGALGELVAGALADSIMTSTEPVSVVVKLHPGYPEERAVFERAFRDRSCDMARVVMEEFDLFDLLRACDVHMSTHSTVLTEAALVDKPNLMICASAFADTVDYLGRGVAMRLEDFPSLSDAVEAVTKGSCAERLCQGRRAFVAAQFHVLDGRAAERVADVVARIAGRRTGKVIA